MVGRVSVLFQCKGPTIQLMDNHETFYEKKIERERRTETERGGREMGIEGERRNERGTNYCLRHTEEHSSAPRI